MEAPFFKPILLRNGVSDFAILREGLAVNTIALVKADHIGDFILAYRTFAAIRNAYPDAYITLVCAPWNEGLAKETGLFDEIVTVTFFSAKSQPGANGLSETDKQKLRKAACDVAIDLRIDPDTRAILDDIETNVRIGYESSCNSKPLTIALPSPNVAAAGNPSVHQSVLMMQLATVFIELCKPGKAGLPLSLSLSGIDLSFAQSKLLAVINTSSGRDIKNWPLERFAALAQWLAKDMDCCVLLVGGKDQTADAQTILDACNDSRVRSLAGEASLLQSFAIIERADIFIGNDSGLTHYAAQKNIRTVALYAGLDPLEVWAARGVSTSIVKVPVPCAPCRIGALAECTNDHACIQLISYSFVRNAVRHAMLGCVPKDRSR